MNIAKLLFVFALTIHFSHSNAEFKQEETFSLTRSDHSIITYYLQKPNKLREKIPLLLVLQGSQFESVFDHDASKQKIPRRFQTALLMIEKPGVEKGSQVCSKDYLEKNDLNSRLQDIQTVVDFIKGESWWNGKMFLLGGSEGGALAVRASGQFTISKAVLLVTGGGMTMENVLPIFIRMYLTEKGAAQEIIDQELSKLPSIISEIKENPQSTKTFWGNCNTYKFWNSVLWFKPVDTMLNTSTKYLLIHGDRDSNHPVESARITHSIFRKSADSSHRLEYWEKNDLDHSLTDSKGVSHMNEIFNNSLNWIFEK